jgi:preprotein translocase subunit SecG
MVGVALGKGTAVLHSMWVTCILILSIMYSEVYVKQRLVYMIPQNIVSHTVSRYRKQVDFKRWPI